MTAINRMTIRATLATMLLAAFLASPGQILSQGQKEDDLQKIAAKYGDPGPEHKYLEPLVGTWKITVKTFANVGEKPLLVSKATTVRTWMPVRSA